MKKKVLLTHLAFSLQFSPDLDESRTAQVLDLRSDISACLEVLDVMCKDMGAFESELGGVSKEIQTMLDDSLQIQSTLNDRLDVEVELEVLTVNLVIDDELIAGIYRAPMNETFMHYAKQLAKKRALIQGARARSEALGDGDSSNLKALEDLEPELSKLIDKMVGRIRHYLLHKILSLQQPSSNVQILQQNMIKHQPLYNVLVDFNLDMASEIKTQYAHTMLNLFYAQFKHYISSLTKCVSELASKYETIGQLDSGRNKVTPGLFALGDRGKWILSSETSSPSSSSLHLPSSASSASLSITNPSSSELFGPTSSRPQTPSLLGKSSTSISSPHHSASSAAAPIILHIATGSKQTYHFERIFLSMQRVLLDTVSGELAFQREFFNSDMFSLVFSSIITWYEETVESYLENCHDAIGVLLMMVVIETDVKTMNDRGIAQLDPYLAMQKQRLAKRLLVIFDNHVESLIAIKVEDLGAIDARPHYLARRYAEFSSAINGLVQRLGNDAHRKMINARIKLLHMHFQSLLSHMAEISAGGDEKKQRLFLVNNYDMILEVLNSNGLDHVLEAQEFQMQFDGEIIHCVDHELQTHFSYLLVFIKRNPEEAIDVKAVTNFAKAFNAHWKAILKKISGDMMRSFPNLKTGVLIMKNVFSQLLTYYKRFEEILKTHHKAFYSQIQVEFVPHASLSYEFSLYTSDFS